MADTKANKEGFSFNSFQIIRQNSDYNSSYRNPLFGLKEKQAKKGKMLKLLLEAGSSVVIFLLLCFLFL